MVAPSPHETHRSVSVTADVAVVKVGGYIWEIQTDEAWQPGIVRGSVTLEAIDDLDDGPPIGTVEHLGEGSYQVCGRVCSRAGDTTAITLETGYPMVVTGDVVHAIEARAHAEMMARPHLTR